MKWFDSIKSVGTPKEIPEVEEYKLKDKEVEQLSASFISHDEKYITSLGNGYIMNYLTNKSVEKGFAFITDKRVYFKGSCLSGTGKKLVNTNEERTVDVKNITGSGFTYHRYYGKIVALLFSTLAALAVAIFSLYSLSDALSSPSYQRVKSTYEYFMDFMDVMNSDNIRFDSDGDIFLVPDRPFNSYGSLYLNVYLDKKDRLLISYNSSAFDFTYTIDVDEEVLERIIREENKEELLVIIRNEIPQIKAAMTTLFQQKDPTAALLGASFMIIILFLPLIIICCVYLKKYLLSRKTLFRIEYAGGCIAFNVSFYAKAEIDDFQKQLRRAKDMAEENTTVKAVTTETPIYIPTQNSSVDDLRKYAELLKDGLITQEEYDAMKKKVLGLEVLL